MYDLRTVKIIQTKLAVVREVTRNRLNTDAYFAAWRASPALRFDPSATQVETSIFSAWPEQHPLKDYFCNYQEIMKR